MTYPISFILLSIMVLLISLVSLGCGTRTTKIFELTPVGSMEDSVTTPDRLSKELSEQKKREDVKRMKRLQEDAKRELVKGEAPAGSVKEATGEEVK
ncbi:MAG: hypothetical protein GY941_03990 [Planctomycetes bacterium]|nr:hypothetical protein [Planctomycetota bacterium]